MRIDGTCDRPLRRVHRPGPSLQKNHQRCRRAEAGTAVPVNGCTSRKIKNSDLRPVLTAVSTGSFNPIPLPHSLNCKTLPRETFGRRLPTCCVGCALKDLRDGHTLGGSVHFNN
jgi:hypothetical protein